MTLRQALCRTLPVESCYRRYSLQSASFWLSTFRSRPSSLRHCHMPTRIAPTPEPENPRFLKKRKIEIPSQKLLSLGAMSANKEPIPTLELTELETTLRQLLLDVAEYIESTAQPQPTSSQDGLAGPQAHAKMELRFTGGWVRDKLLGVESHDIDVAINNMTGYQFGLKMQDYLEIPGNAEKYGLASSASSGDQGPNKSQKPGYGLHKIEANPEKSKHLETVTTRILGLDIDMVNLRKETYTEDSRNPQMEFGTPEEDALRRDATVNAMFYNLNTSTIEDLTKRGFDDMKQKIIRTPLEPYQTFKDDPLRVLRLIRFASRLGYSIDAESEKAMDNAEIKEALKLKISRERVGIEFDKMLNGPDPHTALKLINRLNLLTTIFSDPNKDYGFPPEIGHFAPSYDCVAAIKAAPKVDTIPQKIEESNSDSVIHTLLLRTPEEYYLAWLFSALVPFADAPTITPKPKAKPHFLAEIVSREGIKAPNKICDIITASCRHMTGISSLVDKFTVQSKPSNRTAKGNEDATARDTLGTAIQQWGASWRSQVLFALLYEVANNQDSQAATRKKYAKFLVHVSQLGLLEAYSFKHIIDGTTLAKALDTRPGPWMKSALDVVMAWQLLHPESSAAEAVEALKPRLREDLEKASSQSRKGAGELLRGRLARHILSLIIRPLFAQAKRPSSITSNARKNTKETLPEKFQSLNMREDEATRPWKKAENGYALKLFDWVLNALDEGGVEENWPLLVPPILTMIDEIDVAWKAKGVTFLHRLLKATPPPLLVNTGLGDVFEQVLMPCLSYLPTLTPEKESILLLNAAYPALLTLCAVRYHDSLSATPPSKNPTSHQRQTTLTTATPSLQREKFLDTLLRSGILRAHSHASEYAQLSRTLLFHLRSILTALGVPSVKHLKDTLPLLSGVLSEPMGPAYPPLLLDAATTLQAVVANAWPRIWWHRGEVLRGVCACWVRLAVDEEEEGVDGGKEGFGGVRRELRVVVEMLRAAVGAVVVRGDGGEGVDMEVGEVDLEGEFKVLVQADGRLAELLGVD